MRRETAGQSPEKARLTMADEKTRGVVVRKEIKAFAEVMERRMRGASKKVSAGEIPHHRLMTVEQLLDGMDRNQNHIDPNLADPKQTPDDRLNAAADCANYALFAATRIPPDDHD